MAMKARTIKANAKRRLAGEVPCAFGRHKNGFFAATGAAGPGAAPAGRAGAAAGIPIGKH
jgi:hypothetical protein